MSDKKISSRESDYSQWYNDLVIRGGIADYSAVRGCMVIKPYGYANPGCKEKVIVILIIQKVIIGNI